jgi:hypothetical protein
MGCRDALCSFIENQVKIAEINNGQSLKLTFVDDDWLEVSLIKESLNGQEAAMLRIENQITIW